MATTAPATSIRFTNNEFDFVIDNAKRDPEVYSMMDQFNDAELDYLKGRIRTRTPPKGATAARGQQRLARLQAGTMQQATQPPQEEGLLGKAFGHVPDYGAATQDIMAMRQQQEMQGTMLPPQFQAQQVQEMGGGPGLQTALNVVPGAANILLGTGEMLRHLGEQAKGTTLEMAGKAKQVAETLLPDDFIKKASALASAAGYAATGSAESFLGMLSGKDVEEAGSKMAGEANLKSMRMVEAIIGQTSNIIYEAANEVSWDTPVVATVMSKMGADPPRLAEYVQHDPVGTALALLPFIKVAHGARTFEPHQWKVVEAELRRGRQPGDATTPAEVFERANMFEENRSAAQSAIDAIIPAEETITSTEAPQFGPSTVPMSLTEQARGTLGSRLEQASRPKEAGTFSNVMDALLAEAELVMPDMSRRQLRERWVAGGYHRQCARRTWPNQHPHHHPHATL